MSADLYCPGCGAGLSFATVNVASSEPSRLAGAGDVTTPDGSPRDQCPEVVCRCGRRFSRAWVRAVLDESAPVAPAHVAAAGHELGAVIGRGGMGQVVIARDTALEREVVVKQLLERGRTDERTVARFLREARITGALEHPNIVPVHALGVDSDGSPFFTMKRVGGQTLAAIIAKLRAGDAVARRRFGLVARLQLFRAVCHAVAFAHSRDVIHRDLKPDNVMVGEFGEVLVMDWGLAKFTGRADGELDGTARGLDPSPTDDPDAHGVTHAGAILGTPRYMSPEQAMGHSDTVGPAADVYALGAILYELLALSPAFEEPTVQLLLVRVAEGRFVPPGDLAHHEPVPRELAAVATKAMATDPGARYPGALELLADIEAYLGGYAVSAVRDSPLRALAKWARRNWAATIGACALALGTGGTALVQKLGRERAITARLTALAARLEQGEAAQLAAVEELDRLLEQAPGHARTVALRDRAAAVLARGLARDADDVFALASLERGASLDEQQRWYAAHSRVLAQARRLARIGGREDATRATTARVAYRLARQLTQEGSHGMARLMLDEAAEHGLDPTLLAAERDQLKVAPRLRAERARRLLLLDHDVPPFPAPATDALAVDLALLAGPDLTGVLASELRGWDAEHLRLVHLLLAGAPDPTSRSALEPGHFPAPRDPRTAAALPERLALEVYGTWYARATRDGVLAPTIPERLALDLLARATEPDSSFGARTTHVMWFWRRRDVLDLRTMRLLATLEPTRAGPVIAAVAWFHRPLSRAWTLATSLARRHELIRASTDGLSDVCAEMVRLALGVAPDAERFAPDPTGRETALVAATIALALGERGRPLVDTALALDPQRPEIHAISAAIHERDGDVDAASAAWRRASDLAPMWILPRIGHAAMARRAGRADLAHALAFAIPERFAGLELTLERARALLGQNRAAAALALLDPMIFEAGDDPEFQVVAGQAYGRLGLANAAYRCFETAARADPSDPAYALLAIDDAAGLAPDRAVDRSRAPEGGFGRDRSTDASLGAWWVADPGLAPGRPHNAGLPAPQVRALGAIVRRRLAEHSDDVALHVRSARLDLLLSEVDHATLASGYPRKNFYDMALMAMNAAIAGAPTSELLLARAALLARYARYDEAIHDAEAALARAPSTEGERLLARLRAGKGDDKGEIAVLERSLTRRDEPATRAALGRALVRAGRTDEGRAHLERALAGGVTDPEAFLAVARLAAARGDRASALAHYARARALQTDRGLRIAADDERRALLLASGQASDDDLRTALEDLHEALEAAPERVDYRVLRAQLHAHFGHDELALHDASVALTELPNDWNGRAAFEALAAELRSRLERR